MSLRERERGVEAALFQAMLTALILWDLSVKMSISKYVERREGDRGMGLTNFATKDVFYLLRSQVYTNNSN